MARFYVNSNIESSPSMDYTFYGVSLFLLVSSNNSLNCLRFPAFLWKIQFFWNIPLFVQDIELKKIDIGKFLRIESSLK